jgi:starch phosphorylase
MVQGVDVWLNTPRRPMEASGTSGMKSAANGGIHVSVLDGWWAEAYTPERGWAIGDGQVHDDPEYQDSVEAQALYNLLENEIIPAYYDRPSGYLPLRWIRMMKESIKMGLEFFTSHRMVSDYNQYFYSDARAQYEKLLVDDAKRAKELVAQRHRLKSLWHKVHIEMPQADEPLGVFYVGQKLRVTCKVHLGELKPDEVDVQLYYGPVNSSNEITKSHVAVMDLEKQTGKSTAIYTHEITCESTGRYGFTARVTPNGTDWRNATTAFITWANGDQG